MWLHVTFTFEIVHRRGADRTRNHLVLIEHCKLNDHPIEVEAPHLASPQRHCEFSTLKEASRVTTGSGIPACCASRSTASGKLTPSVRRKSKMLPFLPEEK